MDKITIQELTTAQEKKLVALEMSKDMWKKLRLEAAHNDISFSALVRKIIAKHQLETEAKLYDIEGEEDNND